MQIGWPSLWDGRCDECGEAIRLYAYTGGMPAKETVAVDGKVYCGEACRDAAERKGNADSLAEEE